VIRINARSDAPSSPCSRCRNSVLMRQCIATNPVTIDTTDIIMGNICSSNNNNKTGGRPPRDLNSLVEEMIVTEEDNSLWGAHFRQFLRHRGQTDLEAALDFVALSTRLYAVQEEARQSDSKKRREDLRQDRVSLLRQMGDKYFKPERGDTENIPLANQVLHEELTEALSKVTPDSTEAEVDEACELAWQARNDNRVWKAGLDTSYKTFLANKPSPTVKAVLLSIL